jgi:rubrerythrin
MIEKLTPEACVEFAIRTEEIGAQMYKDLAARFPSDPELRDLFAALAADEVEHGERFRALQGRAASSGGGRISPEQGAYLRAMSMSDVFDTEKLARPADAIRTREDALERALHLEKSTLAYYQAMRDVLGADEVLDALIAVEKKHVIKVMHLMLTGAKFRGLADAYP